jgi:thioredoxin 1
MDGNLIEVTKDNFEKVKKDSAKMVIDCWAEWCGPCRMITPVVERLAHEYVGKVAFGKMDCDTNPELVKRYRIMAIPTLLFFKDGDVVDQIVGVAPKEYIEEMIKKHY